MADASGDLGLTGGAGYADLTGLRIDDAGSRARLTVAMADDVPARLADGEVVGVGVDIFRSNRKESDYQIFLDGGARGWRAFLQTPDGFVRFPGSFTLDGRRLIVDIPWSGLGGPRPGEVSVFADWAKGSGPVGPSSQDTTPDSGTRPFAPG